jgi:hypothetical protein
VLTIEIEGLVNDTLLSEAEVVNEFVVLVIEANVLLAVENVETEIVATVEFCGAIVVTLNF